MSPMGPRVVSMREAEELVTELGALLENLLDLAPLANEHPYNEILLESLIKVRNMSGVIRLEIGAVLGTEVQS